MQKDTHLAPLLLSNTILTFSTTTQHLIYLTLSEGSAYMRNRTPCKKLHVLYHVDIT
jgi:hypothetical protein